MPIVQTFPNCSCCRQASGSGSGCSIPSNYNGPGWYTKVEAGVQVVGFASAPPACGDIFCPGGPYATSDEAWANRCFQDLVSCSDPRVWHIPNPLEVEIFDVVSVSAFYNIDQFEGKVFPIDRPTGAGSAWSKSFPGYLGYGITTCPIGIVTGSCAEFTCQRLDASLSIICAFGTTYQATLFIADPRTGTFRMGQTMDMPDPSVTGDFFDFELVFPNLEASIPAPCGTPSLGTASALVRFRNGS